MTTLTRRDLLRLAAGAASFAATAKTQAKELAPWAPGIKISLQIPNKYEDDDLTFAKQMGVDTSDRRPRHFLRILLASAASRRPA